MTHISDDSLERYCLGRIKDEAELAPLEAHLLACPECVERAEQEQELVDWIRAALRAEGRSLD
jgi:hypothetical protein